MSRNLSMKWNSFYKFWTVLNCIIGTIWCLALVALLGIYSFSIGLISPYIMSLSTDALNALVTLVTCLLVNAIIFLILSYATVPALGKYNKSGLIRIYLHNLTAALSHLVKVILLRDFFSALNRTMPSLDLNNMDVGLYAVFFISFAVRLIILVASLFYFYKRKRRSR